MYCKAHLSLVIFFILGISSCGKKKESIQPTKGNITESVYASATIKSKNQYQLFSTANGIIQDILIAEGDAIKKGDPIIQLINSNSKLNALNAQLAANFAALESNADKMKELEQNIEFARSKLKNDSLLFYRQKSLWNQQIGTLAELEQRELMFKNSKTNHELAILKSNEVKRQLNLAAAQSKNNLVISTTLESDYTIKSEIDGRVYSIFKQKGELVTPSNPIAVIGDAQEFEMEMQVDEYDITRIKIGQKVFVSLDSYKGQVFEAKITKINPFMNDRSRSFLVEAVFVTKPAVLYPNLTAEANILIQSKENVITIPRNYLIDDAFVINENGEKIKVEVGLKDYEKAEIISGISETELILKPGK